LPGLSRGGLVDTQKRSPSRSDPGRFDLAIDNHWGAGTMSVLDFGNPERPVDLIFVHANGFNAATYRSLLEPLAGSLRIWAPDLRGHGRTRLPTHTAGRWTWHDHRDDLVALLDAVKGPPVVLSGHSIGGTSGLLAAAERPQTVSKLMLFDPVIWRPAMVAGFSLFRTAASRSPVVAGALKRRRNFDSREQALAAYVGRGAFKGWPEIAVADYLSDGLVETGGNDGDGGLTLACTPEWEASNYAAQSHNPYRALRRLHRPVRVLKAEVGALCHLTSDPRRDLSVEIVPGGGHLFPMLQPDIARDALFEATV